MELQDNFTRRISIQSPVEKVFDAWAKQGGQEQWMLKSAKYFRNSIPLNHGDNTQKGDQCEWTWYGWPDHKHKGEVTLVETNKTFAFTFDPAGHVTIQFEEIRTDLTDLVLHQTDVPNEGEAWYQYFYGCSLGWSFWLTNLKAWLEHSITLDEKNIQYEGNRKYEVVNQ